MGRKAILDADQKIVDAAIEVGGTSNAKVLFSTVDIGAKAGVSEFVVFSRFKNKEGLLYAALSEATHRRSAELARLVALHLSFEAVTEGLERYLINHPAETMFLINYGESIPKIAGSNALNEAFILNCKKDMHLFDDYYVFPDEESQLIAYTSYIRNVLYDAQFVLSGFEEFDEHCAQTASSLLCSGLIEEKPHAETH
jgi:hypothetical protein